MKTFIVKISPNGSNVEVDAQGFKGKQCTDFMSAVMQALGGTVEEKKKPEFHLTVANGLQARS